MSFEITDDQLHAHFREALTDVEALVTATADLGGDQVAAARSRATDSLRALKSRMTEAQDAIGWRARDVATATDSLVRDRPWEAIGVAAMVGVLLGVLAARR